MSTSSLFGSSSFLSFLTPSPPAAKPPLSPAVVSGELPKNVSGRIAGLYEMSLTKHPQYQSVAGGRILEAPQFNLAYTGPKLADLDIVGADARVTPQHEIEFTGMVLGPINVNQQGIYSFLVDRGGAPSPGPIKGQPGLTFDAVVEVTTNAGKVSSEVSLLNAQDQSISTTPIPATLVQVAGDQVRVTVPESLIPSTAPPSSQPKTGRYTFTFTTSLPGNSESDIAGYASDFTMIAVGDSSPGRSSK